MEDINDIKKHDFFKGLDWRLVELKKYKVPFEMLTSKEEVIIDGIKLEVN